MRVQGLAVQVLRDNSPEGTLIWEIALKAVRHRRLKRRLLWIVVWSGVAFLLVIGPILFVLFIPGQGPLPGDPLRYYAGAGPVAIVMVVGVWFHVRRTILDINHVAVCDRGLYPPFKPKQRLSKGDWFVPYKDIVSMEPVAEKKGLIPAYNMTLKDGLRFQLNALDLLLYVGEGEIRRYEKMLRVIREDLSKPENRARAARDEDVIIPRERFEGAER